MANMKYSRQRAAIKDYLEHTLDHPTADTVYLQVRKEFPNISLDVASCRYGRGHQDFYS